MSHQRPEYIDQNRASYTIKKASEWRPGNNSNATFPYDPLNPFYRVYLSPNQPVIFVMTTNPNPDEVSVIFNGECPVRKSRADRPKLADFPEVKGGMSRVCLEQAEIPFRNPSDRFRESLKVGPEAGCCPVHLKFLEPALLFGFKGFGSQEIQFSAF